LIDFYQMKYYPTYKQSFVLIGIWLLCTIVSAIPVVLHLGIPKELSMAIAYVTSMMFTAIAGFYLRGSWKLAGFAFPLVSLFMGAVLILCIQVLLDPITSLIPSSDALRGIFEGMRNQPNLFFLIVVVAAPFFEEVIFRGIILDGYLKNYKPMHAIVVSAVLFGLIHGNLSQGIGAFVLGVLFGWFYWKTNSILSVIFLHFVNNGLAFLGAVMIAEENLSKSLRELVSNDLFYFSFYTASLITGAGIIYWLYQNWRQSPRLMTDSSPGG
jgi:uncharacterized protein